MRSEAYSAILYSLAEGIHPVTGDFLPDGLIVNCTPKVRQYDILKITLGVISCQKGCRTRGIRQSLSIM